MKDYYSKFLLSLVLIFFTFSKVFSQLNYIDYHSVTSEAENLILDKKYQAAFNKYDSVFQIFPKHFSKDLFNASICALRSKKTEKAKTYLLELADLGLNPKYFYSPAFYRLKTTKGWRSFKKEFKTRVFEAEERKKKDLEVLFIDSLFEIDQKFRMMQGGYAVYGDTIHKIDSLNTIEILKQLSTKGYFTEKKSLIESAPEEEGKFYIILLHLIVLNQRNSNNSIFSNLLLEQVKLGNIHPHSYALLEDRKDDNMNRQNCFSTLAYFIVQHRKVEVQTNAYEINCININRKNIGLENDYNYKRKLNYNHPILNPFCFSTDWGIVHLSGMKYKEFKKFWK